MDNITLFLGIIYWTFNDRKITKNINTVIKVE